MDKHPYVRPALESFGDVVTVTQQTAGEPVHYDAVYPSDVTDPNKPGYPNIYTDNLV